MKLYKPSERYHNNREENNCLGIIDLTYRATMIQSVTRDAGEFCVPVLESTPFSGGSIGSEKGNPRCDYELMYEAATKGNWEAAEKLLQKDKSLACGEQITQRGDRALHVAIANKHTEMVRKLIECVDLRELNLQDGHGYTACCYAAMTGILDVATIILGKNPNLCNTPNKHATTPLQLAVFYGNAEVVTYFLESGRDDGNSLTEERLFDLLLDSIRSKMYDVALKILEIDGRLARMTNDVDGTALHILAQLDISSGKWQPNLGMLAGKLWAKIKRLVVRGTGDEETQPDPRLSLAKKLWDGIQKLERARVVELMEKPPILHDAAKVGNVDLIAMISCCYPELLWHIAVMYRQEGVLELIKQTSITDFHAISQFENGNNILHLTAKLLRPDGLKILLEPDLHMLSELAWFKEVEKIVPPVFLEKRNNDGYKPKELFWKEHKSLLEESRKHMKTTAESCMLIATIILTVVFAAAFTPPGGYDQKTGIPLLLKNNWFASFVIFEVLALFSSTYSILTFWSIISSNYDEEQFLRSPNHLRHALSALLSSVLYAISAFLSAFFLVFVRERKALVISFMLPVYVWLVVGVSFQFFKLFPKTNLIEYYSRRGASPSKYSFANDSLWSRLYVAGKTIVSSIWDYINHRSSNKNNSLGSIFKC